MVSIGVCAPGALWFVCMPKLRLIGPLRHFYPAVFIVEMQSLLLCLLSCQVGEEVAHQGLFGLYRRRLSCARSIINCRPTTGSPSVSCKDCKTPAARSSTLCLAAGGPGNGQLSAYSLHQPARDAPPRVTPVSRAPVLHRALRHSFRYHRACPDCLDWRSRPWTRDRR